MTQKPPHPTLHVVIGPTASGKSEFAVKLAKKYNGEIISADSRQVYKGLDIGTGKVPGKWVRTPSNSPYPKGKTNADNGSFIADASSGPPPKIGGVRGGMKSQETFVYKNVPHHVIDFVSPKRQYTVADFKRDGTKALLDIIARGKTPIMCGGTGQYVDALLMDQSLPEVPPDPSLRAKLEKKTTTELFAELKKKDPVRAAGIDPHNPRRLIRALEIIATLGKVPETFKQVNIQTYKQHGLELPIEIHYLNPAREELYTRIEKRLKQRIKEGMVQEIINLNKKGISWKWMDGLGLEYRYISQYLQSMSGSLPRIGRVSLSDEALAKSEGGTISFFNSPQYLQLLSEIKHYAKRQQTWFKKYCVQE